MSIQEKTIGAVTVGNEVEIDKDNYSIPYYDERFKAEFTLLVPRSVIEKQFHATGRARGVFSYYFQDEGVEHELTFEEFEENNDYRDEFDALVQEIAIETLNLHAVEKSLNQEETIELYQLSCKIKDLSIMRLQFAIDNLKLDLQIEQVKKAS